MSLRSLFLEKISSVSEKRSTASFLLQKTILLLGVSRAARIPFDCLRMTNRSFENIRASWYTRCDTGAPPTSASHLALSDVFFFIPRFAEK